MADPNPKKPRPSHDVKNDIAEQPLAITSISTSSEEKHPDSPKQNSTTTLEAELTAPTSSTQNGLEKSDSHDPGSDPDPNPDTGTDANLTLWQSVKKYRRVVYYSLGITSAILMYGYDHVIIGTISAMPSFQRDFGQLYTSSDGAKTEWILPSHWLALWNFISPFLSMPGALLAGSYQDCFGRRSSLALGSILSALGVLICFLSNISPQMTTRRALFFAGKGLQGGAIGAVMATSQTYLSEILPPCLRGPLLAFFPIFTLLGQVIGALVIFGCLELENGYRVAFASQWVFSALPVIMAFIVPESPVYLVRKNRQVDALRAQARFRSHSAHLCRAEPASGSKPVQTSSSSHRDEADGKSQGHEGQREEGVRKSGTGETTGSYASDGELDGVDEETRLVVSRITRDIEHEKQSSAGKATYAQCFRGSTQNLRRTLIVMFAALIPQLFGLTLLSKASYFIQIVGMDADLSVIILILGIVVGLIANIASMWVVDRFDRRTLIMSGLCVSTLLWGGMGIAGIWTSSKVVVWYSAASMILVITVCGLGCWPCSFAVGSEVSALELRAKAQGVGWFTAGAAASLFGFVLPYIFNPDQGNLRAKTGFVFAGLCALGAGVTFFYVPEMKGRAAAEIDGMFELGLEARAFKGWKGDVGDLGQSAAAGDSKEGGEKEVGRIC